MNRSLRLTLLPLLAAIALFSCGTNTPLVPPEDDAILNFGTDASLEIVTWNLRTFPLDTASIQTIAQIIPQTKADVIAFQEIMDYTAFNELVSEASAAAGTRVTPRSARAAVSPSRRFPGFRDTATTVLAPMSASWPIKCGPMFPVAPTTR